MDPSTPRPGSGAATAPPALDGPRPPHADAQSEPSTTLSRTPSHLSRGLASVAELAEGFGEHTLAEEARAALQPLEENVLRMVALGQFKRGKSTLLNALLQAGVLPAGVAPVTSVSTVVRWSPEPCLTVIYENGETRSSEFARLADFVAEARNPGNALGVRLVEVGYPASLLEDGLVFVDTPGIGSADRRATERAYGFLPSVDAGLVVLSPDPPVGQAEAEYIRELAALTPHLLFVLNKIDRVTEPEWREVLAFNQQVLADVLDQPPEDIDIIPVSARRALEDAGGRVEALRDRVASFIAQKGARVREDLAVRRSRAIAAKLRARLDVERHALEMGERELDGRIEGLRATLSSLQGRTDRATRTVMAAVEDIVARSGDEMVAYARSRAPAMAEALVDMLRSVEPDVSNAAVAGRFDKELADETWSILDAWWEHNGTGTVEGLLGEMDRASDDLLQARREASEWIRSAFGVRLPEEPRIEALKESGSFYRRVEGVTPRLTLDMLRVLLPRGLYRAWVRRSVPRLVARALDMGAGQVRGDLLYRARETARAFAAELRTWTLAGTEGLVEAVGRASALQKQTRAAAQDRRWELDAGLAELDRLADGAR